MKYDDLQIARHKVTRYQELQREFEILTKNILKPFSRGSEPRLDLNINGWYLRLNLNIDEFNEFYVLCRNAIVSRMEAVHKELMELGLTDLPEVPNMVPRSAANLLDSPPLDDACAEVGQQVKLNLTGNQVIMASQAQMKAATEVAEQFSNFSPEYSFEDRKIIAVDEVDEQIAATDEQKLDLLEVTRDLVAR